MKACVHYYNIVSVDASSAGHILDQMKYVTECYRLSLLLHVKSGLQCYRFTS